MAESMLMKGQPMHMLSTNGGTNKRIGSVPLKRVMHSWHARPRASFVCSFSRSISPSVWRDGVAIRCHLALREVVTATSLRLSHSQLESEPMLWRSAKGETRWGEG